MADPNQMNKSVWRPVQGQTIYLYELMDEELTSTMWDDNDPYLLGLWERGKVFASRSEALAAQDEGFCWGVPG